MSSARAVCKCVVIGGKRGVGETWVLRSGRQLSSQKFVLTPSLSACWCRRSSGNTHAIVLLGPRQAFSYVARAVAWAYQTPGTQPMGRAGEYSGCGVVWCGVVWCGVVWCGVVWCGVVWCGVVWCGVVWCGVVWCGVVWCGVVWCGVVWCGVVWCGVVWCGVVWWWLH